MTCFTDKDLGQLFLSSDHSEAFFAIKIIDKVSFKLIGPYAIKPSSYCMYLGVRKHCVDSISSHTVNYPFVCFLVDDITVGMSEHLFCKSSSPIVFKGLLDNGDPDGTVRDQNKDEPIFPLNIHVGLNKPLSKVHPENPIRRLWNLFHNKFIGTLQ
jgi:hypothetical protein